MNATPTILNLPQGGGKLKIQSVYIIHYNHLSNLVNYFLVVFVTSVRAGGSTPPLISRYNSVG
jgi:hypothetical protein